MSLYVDLNRNWVRHDNQNYLYVLVNYSKLFKYKSVKNIQIFIVVNIIKVYIIKNYLNKNHSKILKYIVFHIIKIYIIKK